ncbi:MAG: hypothetical protein M3Q58_14835, partial [Bacteroidota bacterium]|nr:hypothetical protein [Bacteroidota bacterium]
MKKNYTLKTLAAIAVSFMMIFSANSQTVLIHPAADGGFSNGPTFADNGWTVENGSVTNQWHLGTVPAVFPSTSAYVSNDNGVTNSYTNNSISVVHFYRDVTFPAGETSIDLSFDWRSVGEASFWDGIIVSLAPVSYTPTASATSLNTGSLAAPAIEIGRAFNSTTVQTANFVISPLLAGNCTGSSTMRLIFTWKNDGSGGTNPAAAIDNITLISTIPSPSSTAGPYT